MTIYKVGVVTHFFDKLGVAIVELSNDLAVGERIRFSKDDEDVLDQTVHSIQIEHKKVDSAKAGSVVGLKTDEKVQEGTEVFKLQ